MKVEVVTEYDPTRGWRNLGCSADHKQEHYEWALARNPNLKKCKLSAIVRVDGVALCRIHAGFKLIAYAVDKGEI